MPRKVTPAEAVPETNYVIVADFSYVHVHPHGADQIITMRAGEKVGLSDADRLIELGAHLREV